MWSRNTDELAGVRGRKTTKILDTVPWPTEEPITARHEACPRCSWATLAAVARPEVEGEAGLSPVNILVVDDREDGRRALLAILASERCQVVEAASGAEALKQLLRLDFAVVLLDMIMPGMDGFEVASLIRARTRTRATPIIFLTGHAANVASIYDGYAAGAVDYLIKPLDSEVLRAKVRTFVDLHRQRDEIRRQAALLRAAERARLELSLAQTRLAADRRYARLAEAILVRQIVEAHGGSIGVVSETGAGSTFTVELPLDFDPPGLSEPAGASEEL